MRQVTAPTLKEALERSVKNPSTEEVLEMKLKSMTVAVFRGLIALAGFAVLGPCTVCAKEAGNEQRVCIHTFDQDHDGKDSPGDIIEMNNSRIALRFRFVDVNASPQWNGYCLDLMAYRGETCFKQLDGDVAGGLYPVLRLHKDVVGMSMTVNDPEWADNPYMWTANAILTPTVAPGGGVVKRAMLPSYEAYTLYEKHETRGQTLVFTSQKRTDRAEELTFTLDGTKLRISHTVTNTGTNAAVLPGIVTLPAYRIINTYLVPWSGPLARKVPAAGYTDNYTLVADNPDGLTGSGMLFWSHAARDASLHMEGLFTWSAMRLKPGEKGTREVSVTFLDENIDRWYAGWLAKNSVTFDKIDWNAVEQYMADKTPQVMMPEGYVYHSYNNQPIGSKRDWHNEMTGRALMIKGLDSGDGKWFDYTRKANQYYYDCMFHKDPASRCYGYFRDQSTPDKLSMAYPWSQPYNAESYLAEYAVTRDPTLKDVLLLHFEKMYDGPLYNRAGKRWLWGLDAESGKEFDFGVFDAQEFGVDVMISAYEFTGDRKYLDRALEVMNKQRPVLENFGLLMEDTAGEPSVNTSAFASKILFKLYEHTGDAYWRDRAVRILNSLLYSRVYMQNFPPGEEWLKGALARKDANWLGGHGEPDSGTDSFTASMLTFIPWVMEALVAGYNHTGNSMYTDYMQQLLHHQMEANKRLLQASGGKAEFCGHYSLYHKRFDMTNAFEANVIDNDGLTLVSNLFLFPYAKAFRAGLRSPHSTAVLLSGADAAHWRLFHLAGINENVQLLTGSGKVAALSATGVNGERAQPVAFKATAGGITFLAQPYQMYAVTLDVGAMHGGSR
jgi:hypothetical protein